MHACTFIGHRECPESVKPILYKELENLIVNCNVRNFYVGTHGDFDRIVYETLCKLEKVYSIKISVVLAYLSSLNKQTYYDVTKTIYPDVLAKTPFKFAISKRNDFMIRQSQYMICYVNYTNSNASKFVKTAVKRNLKVKNLGSFDLKELS